MITVLYCTKTHFNLFTFRVKVWSVHYACLCSAPAPWCGWRGARTAAASRACASTSPSRYSRRGCLSIVLCATRACIPQVTTFYYYWWWPAAWPTQKAVIVVGDFISRGTKVGGTWKVSSKAWEVLSWKISWMSNWIFLHYLGILPSLFNKIPTTFFQHALEIWIQ